MRERVRGGAASAWNVGRRLRQGVIAFSVCVTACARDHARSPDDEVEPVTRVSHVHPRGQLGCSSDELSRPAKKVITGLASYYANSLAGNRTANGDRYDPKRLTAAHRSLPFGTRVRVTRTDAATPVVCLRVNDRGPFAGRRRVLDISRKGAEALHMIGPGVVPVKVEVL